MIKWCYIGFGFFMLLTLQTGRAQDAQITGSITFKTTRNIYVRFADATSIQVGDTLSLSDGIKCLLVQQKSSTSCVCTSLNGCDPQTGDVVYFAPVVEEIDQVVTPIVPEALPVLPQTTENEENTQGSRQSLTGRFSASTYSTISGQRADRHRFMSQLVLDADHINNSDFSANLNLNYRHILDEGATEPIAQHDLLRVYNFGFRYDSPAQFSATIGRHINPRFSSVGPLDGLQLEQRLGNHILGVLAGTRPDLETFGFNADLLQYGAYYGFQTENNRTKVRTSTTLGGLEQRFGAEIDRRFGYFQHNSSYGNRFFLFGSAEVDVYQPQLVTQSEGPRLTNLYASARYRVNRGLNFMVSYDSRKRIIYYETYRTELDRILDDDLARQGIRARVNFRPGKNVYSGLSYSKRFRSDQQNASDNYYGYLTLAKTPGIGGRTALSFTRNESNYLINQIGALRHSRSLFQERLQADVYYRLVQSDYLNFNDPVLQHYGGVDFTYYLSRSLFLSVTGEYATYQGEDTYRVYTRIVQRFHAKRK